MFLRVSVNPRLGLGPTLISLINAQSVITLQVDKFYKKNKRTGQKSSPIRVQVSFFQKICKFTLACEQILLRILIRQACHQFKIGRLSLLIF